MSDDTPAPLAATPANAPWVAFYEAMLTAVDPSKPKAPPIEQQHAPLLQEPP